MRFLRCALGPVLLTLLAIAAGVSAPPVHAATVDLHISTPELVDRGWTSRSTVRGRQLLQSYVDTHSLSFGTPATNPRIVITLPPGSLYAPTASVSSQPPPSSCVAAGLRVTCPVTVGYEYITVPYLAPSTDGSYQTQVSLVSDDTDPNPSDNTRSYAFSVSGFGVDVSPWGGAAAIGADSEIRAGEPFAAILNLRDFEPEAIPSGTVLTTSFALPAGVSLAAGPFDDLEPGVSCSSAGSQVTCTVPFNGEARIQLRLLAGAAGSFEVPYEVGSSTTELSPDDNARSIVVVVHPAAAVDQCSNIDGFQAATPPGMVRTGTECRVPAVDPAPVTPAPPTQPTQSTPTAPVADDVCPNLDGGQALLPAGWFFLAAGGCGQGSALADRLLGDGRGNAMFGGGGNDRLLGLGGPDKLDGGAGSDELVGGAGDDTLAGRAGNDRLTGGPGRDVHDGGAGNDSIRSRDGRAGEVVRCGAGRDVVTADARDRVGPDCEVVQRP